MDSGPIKKPDIDSDQEKKEQNLKTDN